MHVMEELCDLLVAIAWCVCPKVAAATDNAPAAKTTNIFNVAQFITLDLLLSLYLSYEDYHYIISINTFTSCQLCRNDTYYGDFLVYDKIFSNIDSIAYSGNIISDNSNLLTILSSSPFRSFLRSASFLLGIYYEDILKLLLYDNLGITF